MIVRSLLFIFVILFASQTIAAVFDSHTPHQTSSTHNTNIAHNNHLEVSASDGTMNLDCHHCCHCHTPSSTAAQVTEHVSMVLFSSEKLCINSSFAESASVSPEHRPPIT